MIAMWQVFARLWNIQARVDAWEREKLIRSGIRMGIAYATDKPVGISYRDYPPVLDEQASGAYARLLDKPPVISNESATYEPPQKETGPIKKPLLSARDVAKSNQYQASMTRHIHIPPAVLRKDKDSA